MTEAHEPTVFIVDDDPAVLRSTAALLRTRGYAIETYGSADLFLAGYDRAARGCVLADVRMPGMTGLDLQDRLAAEDAPLAVVLMTGHGDVPMAVNAMKAGAVDFIEKPFSRDVLFQSVERALAAVVPTGGGVGGLDPEAAERLAQLTPREHDVLGLLVQGLTNKAIAFELGISQRTVEIHRARVRDKMGARSLSDLIRMMR